MFKKIGIISFLVISLSACSDEISNNTVIEQNIAEINSNLYSVSVSNFKLEIDKKESILVDLRTSSEVAKGVIKGGAINIDFYSGDFKEKLNSLDKNKKYLIYCRSGARSGRALGLMEKLGFTNVINLSGGINSWINSDGKIVDFKK